MKRLIKLMFMLLAGVIIISASGLLYLRHCDWSPENAAKYATEKAKKKVCWDVCSICSQGDNIGRNTIICGWRCVEL